MPLSFTGKGGGAVTGAISPVDLLPATAEAIVAAVAASGAPPANQKRTATVKPVIDQYNCYGPTLP